MYRIVLPCIMMMKFSPDLQKGARKGPCRCADQFMQTLAGPSLVVSMRACVRARAPCMSMDVSRMLGMRVSNWALRNPGEGFYSNRWVL